MLVLEPDKGILRKAGKKELYEAVYLLTMLIPIGKVTTYKSIAKILGIHPRTVGIVLKKNSKPIIVPCHRVISSNGSIGGYSWGGKNVKKKLLEIEGVRIIGEKVDPEYIIDIGEQLIS
ncbi:MGMT family protein [Staphylothermus hellenicus]|uniref:Methylated-DNA/protein-cysteine methyltransferase n=1 Tax=Staphylothermus hellenicus (strain DSM 12710 / JCM 10830 / BK20S6-10-b1 / P8) TaxID=591019 RepID=D7D7Z3_STAHD|nr:MGMT family protein [Staphylothermus hellenicus]ADI31889.1 methylated-DNA/protein-cysteine methyltransferase [Staphylothermus hellenicus DSM 12710]